jgi:DNA-binding CsgD family transcriptional regulator
MLLRTEKDPDLLVGRDEALAELAHGLETAAGAVVVGPAGIGKSALIRVAAADPAFYPVRIRGSRESGKTPFGALAWLISELAEDVESRPEQLLQELTSLLAGRAAGRRVLLLLDNVESLDHWTGMAVSQLVRRSGASVLAAAESFAESAPDVMALWTEGLLVRVDLGPLVMEQTRELMQNLLSGPVSTLAAQSMHRHSGGNPQLITLLVQDQTDDGSLMRHDGVWVLAKPLAFSGQAAEVITSRLKRLPPDERSLVQLLALARDLPLSVVLKLFPAETVDRLEEARVVEISDQSIHLASTGTAAAIAAAIPPGRSRELWEEVSALLDPQMLRPSALIRFARWTLASQGTLDPETAERAAILSTAHDDPASALQFLRAVPQEKRGPAMLLAEVQALRESGNYLDALRALDRLPSPLDPREPAAWVELMLQRAALLQLLPRHGNAAETLHNISAAIQGHTGHAAYHQWEAQVVLMHSAIAIDAGRPKEVPGRLGSLAADRKLSPAVRMRALALHAQFLAVSGDFEELLTVVQPFKDGFQGTLGANTMDSAHIRFLLALVAAGEHRLAEELVADLKDGANRRAFRGSAGDVALGGIHALCGRADSALAALTSAMSQIRVQDPFDVLPLVHALSARVLALQGDVQDAQREASDDAEFRYRPQELVGSMSKVLGLEAMLAGDTQKLCGELRSIAKDNLRTGMVPIALHCLAAAAGRGDREAAAELAAAASGAKGRWASALHCLGTGLAQGNPSLLLESAALADELGNDLMCHTAAAAALHLLEGQTGSDSRVQARTALRLEHASFRKLRQANSIQARMAALSPFEADLARRAAGTATRKEISAELHLSPRTIDWHLGKIFDKLHVSGRSELGEVLR